MTATPVFSPVGASSVGQPRHFLDLDAFDAKTLRHILALSAAYKGGTPPDGKARPLQGRTLAMIFEKPSTRTRVSFEVGMKQLGGETIVLTRNDTQLGRGETIADTARVLSRYVDAIMIRTDNPHKLVDLAEHALVPVINGLTDATHPCQVMADIMTFKEHRGSLKGKVVAWSGDGNNVAASWIQASAYFGFEMRLACPESLRPSPWVLDWAAAQGGKVTVTTDPEAAVAGAHLVMTDTWVSMGNQEGERRAMLGPYQINAALMKKAAEDVLFMHCLPAHRNEEVTDEIMDGPHSVVWDQAENRLHVQKGILSWCFGA